MNKEDLFQRLFKGINEFKNDNIPSIHSGAEYPQII